MNKDWKNIIIITFLLGIILPLILFDIAPHLISFVKFKYIPPAPTQGFGPTLAHGLAYGWTAIENSIKLACFILLVMFMPLLLLYWASIRYACKGIHHNHKTATVVFTFITLCFIQIFLFIKTYTSLYYISPLITSMFVSGIASSFIFILYYSAFKKFPTITYILGCLVSFIGLTFLLSGLQA